MTPDVVAVLVVPAPGDPGGLLKIGGRSPRRRVGWPGDASVRNPRHIRIRDEAAVLLWMDPALAPDWWDGWSTLREILPVADWMVAAGAAARVVRLTRVDGRLVELEPTEVTP